MGETTVEDEVVFVVKFRAGSPWIGIPLISLFISLPDGGEEEEEEEEVFVGTDSNIFNISELETIRTLGFCSREREEATKKTRKRKSFRENELQSHTEQIFGTDDVRKETNFVNSFNLSSLHPFCVPLVGKLGKSKKRNGKS